MEVGKGKTWAKENREVGRRVGWWYRLGSAGGDQQGRCRSCSVKRGKGALGYICLCNCI